MERLSPRQEEFVIVKQQGKHGTFRPRWILYIVKNRLEKLITISSQCCATCVPQSKINRICAAAARGVIGLTELVCISQGLLTSPQFE